jgi:hypothetical protein
VFALCDHVHVVGMTQTSKTTVWFAIESIVLDVRPHTRTSCVECVTCLPIGSRRQNSTDLVVGSPSVVVTTQVDVHSPSCASLLCIV